MSDPHGFAEVFVVPRSPSGWTRRLFFRLALPAVWLPVAYVSSRHPGDEYGLFAVAHFIPIVWAAFVVAVGDIHRAMPFLLAGGAAFMAALGWVMDRLRVRRRIWAVLVATLAVLLFLWAFWSHPTYERAVAKNGSLTAYLAAAFNLGLTLASLVCLAANVAERVTAFTLGRSRRDS